MFSLFFCHRILLTQSKICYLDSTEIFNITKQYVIRFEIAVHNVTLVYVRYTSEDIFYQVTSFFVGKLSPLSILNLFNHIRKPSSCNKFHPQI